MISRRIAIFALLALFLAGANAWGLAVAMSLFVTRVGADRLPFYLMLYAAASVLGSTAFSAVVDRWPRWQLLVGFLSAGAAAAAAVPYGGAETPLLFFSLYILTAVFFELCHSLYYVVLADHFTATEINRGTKVITFSTAAGGALGAAGLAGAAQNFTSSELLFGMPILLAAALVLFVGVRASVVALGEAEPQGNEGLWRSLRDFRPLAARYPIVSLIATGVLLGGMAQSFAQYQALTTYTNVLPQERTLIIFIATLSATFHLLAILANYALATPLISRIGVGRMNLFYPLLSVCAFAAFAGRPGIPAAVAMHAVHDPLARGVGMPVSVANYNALPERFIRRVRILNDGLLAPFATGAAGAALYIVQDMLTPQRIALVGLGLALLFLINSVRIRQAYAGGLTEVLKTGSLDLDKVHGRKANVPREYHAEIRRLLDSGDHHHQILGLELASRADAQAFTREIETLLGQAVAPVKSAFVSRFGSRLTPQLVKSISDLLAAEEAAVRALAVEALLVANHPLDAGDIAILLRDPAPAVASIAALAALRSGHVTDASTQALNQAATGPEPVRLRLLQVIHKCRDPRFVPLLSQLRVGATPNVLTAVMDAATDCGVPVTELRTWMEEGFPHADAHVRRAAYHILMELGSEDAAERLARGLTDPVKEVRMIAAAGLGSLGPAALSAVRDALERGDVGTEEAAIEAVGRISGQDADDVLYRHLVSRHFAAVRRNMQWLAVIPANDAPWRALEAALVDGNQRALDAALQTLSALGYRQTLKVVRRILAAGGEYRRANAVDAIATLGHRRYVQPLLPLLELGIELPDSQRSVGTDAELSAVLAVAVRDDSRWVKAGALMAASHRIEEDRAAAMAALGRDSDPIVTRTFAALNEPPQSTEPIMNRLLFLKSVPLFRGLSLDDLLSVDGALGQEDFLDGETVVTQGDTGATLYILFKGTASVRLGAGAAMKEIARLQPGEFFGEMALFDDQPRSATVVAVGEATLLTLERERFSTLVTQRPEVLLHMCKMFGNRLREANRQIMVQ